MGKTTNKNAKQPPKSKPSKSKFKIVTGSKEREKNNHVVDETPIVNFTPDDRAKILSIYHYLSTKVKRGTLDKTVETFRKELVALFGQNATEASTVLDLKFEGEVNSKAFKKAEGLKIAKELELKAKALADAARKAAEEAAASDSTASSVCTSSSESSSSISDRKSKQDTNSSKKGVQVDVEMKAESNNVGATSKTGSVTVKKTEALDKKDSSSDSDTSSSSSSSSSSDSDDSTDSEDEDDEKAPVAVAEKQKVDDQVADKKTEALAKKDSSTDSSSSSSSSSSDSDDSTDSEDEDDEKAPVAVVEKQKVGDKKTKPLAKKNSSSDSSSSSSSSDSDDSTDSEDEDDEKAPGVVAEKQKVDDKVADKKTEALEKQTSPSDSSSSSSSSDSDDSTDSEADEDLTPTAVEQNRRISEESNKKSITNDSTNRIGKHNGKKTGETVLHDNNDHDDKDVIEPPSKKMRPNTPIKVTQDDESDVSDTDVSDVEVSEVSSVETSSDEESSSSSESDGEDDSDDGSSSDSSSSSSSDDDSSSSDEEDAEVIRQRKAAEAKRKAAAAAAAAANWVPTPPKKLADIKVEKGTDGAQALNKGTPFKRVDDQYWGEVAQKNGGAMADNSYEGAFGESGFGAKASQKLLQVQGRRFQHEKTKAKRSYNGFAKTGQGITLESFSSKFQYSDDE